MEQDRLRRCAQCGEFAGEALVDDRWEGPVYVPVVCACDGIVCKHCGRRSIRRPISNRYVESTGQALHTPWFTGLFACAECRR